MSQQSQLAGDSAQAKAKTGSSSNDHHLVVGLLLNLPIYLKPVKFAEESIEIIAKGRFSCRIL